MRRIVTHPAVTHAVAIILGAIVALYAAGWLFPAKPGGVWLTPPNGATVNGPFLVAVRAYKTKPWDYPIHYVNITAKWQGVASGSWPIPCVVTKPVEGDVYECTIDPVALGIPPKTQFQISFDVYDTRRGANLAPNGVHTLTFSP